MSRYSEATKEFNARKDDAYLEHYGVKGMRWGVRKSTSEKAEKWQGKRDTKVDKWATRKATKTGRFGGEATLVRQEKKIAKVNERLTKDKYKKGFAKRDAQLTKLVEKEAAKDPSWNPGKMTRAQENYIKARATDRVVMKETGIIWAKNVVIKQGIQELANVRLRTLEDQAGYLAKTANEQKALLHKQIIVQQGANFAGIFASSLAARANRNATKALRLEMQNTYRTERTTRLREKLNERG